MLALSMISIGIPTTVSKIVAKKISIGDNKGAYCTFKISLMLFSVISISASILLIINAKFIAVCILKMKECTLSFIMLAPSIFLVSVISVFKGYFAGRQNMKATATAQSIDQLVKTIGVVTLIELSIMIIGNTNTEIFAACASFTTTLANIAELIYMYTFYIKNKPVIEEELKETVNHKNIRKTELIKEIILTTIPIQLTGLISSIGKNIDSTSIVGGLQSKIGYEEAKKQYGILSGKVDALINLPLSFNMAIATALLPRIAACNNDRIECEKKINQSLLCTNLIALPTLVCFIMFAKEILLLLFPNAPDGANILIASSISIIFITIEQITGQVLQGIGKTKISIIALLIGVGTKAIINRILVPKTEWIIGGTIGATIATLICHIIVCIIELSAVLKITKIKIEKKTIVKPIMITIIFIIISKIMYESMKNFLKFKTNLIISIGIAVIFYIFYLYKIKIIKIQKASKIKGYRR